jgi:hypothetical protein
MHACFLLERLPSSLLEKMYTIRQAAEITGASITSLRIWLADEAERSKRFPNARKENSPIGDYWLIPESDVTGYENPGRGRPRKHGLMS